MKILHIIDSMSMGGAENLVCSLAINQKKQGNEVEVVELMNPNNPTLRTRLAEAGVKDYVVGSGSPYNPLLTFKLMKYMKWADVVHVHLFPALYWAALGKKLGCCKVPMVYTEHSTKNKRRGNKLTQFIDKSIYHSFKEVVACSDKALETYRQLFPEMKTSVIPNGVNIEAYINAEPYTKKELIGADEDCFLITMVASFRYPKRQDLLVKALKELPLNCHEALVGGGGDTSAIQSLAEELGVDERVHFLGIRSDVPRILKTSDVVVMASEYEGLSLSSIEGMSVKPFIASNVNGLREVVKDAGLLFDINKPEELAAHLQKLIDDKEYYTTIKVQCYQRAKQFDIADVTKKYLEVYERSCIN